MFGVQFGRLMEVLHGMMDQIERQRLSKMMDEMPDNVAMQQRCTLRRRCFTLTQDVHHQFNNLRFYVNRWATLLLQTTKACHLLK